MKERDRKNFTGAIKRMASLYGKTLPPEGADSYFDLLQDYDSPSLHVALDQAQRTFKFLPRPSELLEIIEANREREYRLWVKADNERGNKRHTQECLDAWKGSQGLGQCVCGANVTVVGEDGLATVVAREKQKDPAPK